MDIEEAKKIFGVKDFRGSQEKIIHGVFTGSHSLVIMPTGMGKSLCYQIPGVMLDGLTIVLSPLIALMQDQTQKLISLGVDALFINSSLSKKERLERYMALKQGKGKFLYVAPERFRKREFLESIENRKIALLAIDEAHCISQWGHDFRPDYTKIKLFREKLGNPVTMALTATATREVQKDIILQMGLAEKEITLYNEGICRPNLFLGVETFVDEPAKFAAIISRLRKEANMSSGMNFNKDNDIAFTKGSRVNNQIESNKLNDIIAENDSLSRYPVIIYFNLVKSLEKFSHLLDMNKITHTVYHGKLPPEKRRRVQADFLKSNSGIMLSTNAFGMGIDKANIRSIWHAEIPASLEAYYQEIGRAGRDYLPSECLLFYHEDDLAVLMDFIEWQNPDEKFIMTVYHEMRNLGDKLKSFGYDELQEKLTFKNRGDQRLQTVLNLFDRYGVTSGTPENFSLKLLTDLPDELISAEHLLWKKKNSRMRLYQMLQYAKTLKCRREFVYEYFNASFKGCNNCDFCLSRLSD